MRLTPTLLAGVALFATAAAFAADGAAKKATPLPTPPGIDAPVYRAPNPELADGLRVQIFKPAGWKAGDRRAGFIWFFGGGWTRGTPENSAWWAKWAAAQGMVALAPDYRVKDRHGTSPLAAVADARAALRWAQEHAAQLGLDPQRIVVGGNSAGGHLALWTAIAHTPPGSAPAEAPLARPIALILTSAVSDTSKASGYAPTRFGENAQALSPVHQLDARMPPVLAFHGDADHTVPFAQALALRQRLRATGNVCELVTVPHGSHNYGGDQPEWAARTQALAAEFLKQHGVL